MVALGFLGHQLDHRCFTLMAGAFGEKASVLAQDFNIKPVEISFDTAPGQEHILVFRPARGQRDLINGVIFHDHQPSGFEAVTHKPDKTVVILRQKMHETDMITRS